MANNDPAEQTAPPAATSQGGGPGKTLKDSALIRWTVLIIISFLFFATYWFQDVFSPLAGLMESQLGIKPDQFGVVVSATTWANCLGMILVGGFILDRWGIRISGLLFGLLVTLGGALTTLGASDVLVTDPAHKLWLMAAGRIVFGIGLEITCVIVSRTVVKWFKGKEMALAMAINVGFGRLGSFFAVSFSLDIADRAVVPALGFAASLIGAAFILFLVYFIFDKKLDNQLKREESVDEDEKFHFTDFLQLLKNPTFIWIALLCVTYYSAVFPFIGAYGPSILHHNFGFSMADLPKNWSSLSLVAQAEFYLTNGPKITGLIPLGSIVFTPIFGSLVDRRGKAASMMLIGSVLLIFSHVTLTFSNTRALAYPALFSLGVAFSLVPAAMWPSVAKIVKENRLGTAYASMFTVQNWGLALFYWLPGLIVTLTNEGGKAAQGERDYTWATLPFILLGLVSILLAVKLMASNRKHNLALQEPFGK